MHKHRRALHRTGSADATPNAAPVEPSRPRLLCRIGDVDSEFAAIDDWISRRWRSLPGAAAASFPSIASAMASGDAPELVVVLQRHPDEFPAQAAEQLLAQWPIARVLCCWGAWCASEGRSRNTWPLALRVPVEKGVERLEAELAVLEAQRSPLPTTASRDEIFRWSTLSTER